MDYINNLNKHLLLISLASNGILVPVLGFPVPTRSKSCYFVKTSSVALTKDNLCEVSEQIFCLYYTHLAKYLIFQVIVFGDVSWKSMEQLAVFFDAVAYPLLINAGNRTMWPQCVVKDVDDKLKDLLNTITDIKGNFNNETILAIPPNIEDIHRIGKEIQNE